MKRSAQFRSEDQRVFHVFRAKYSGIRSIVIVEWDRREIGGEGRARGGLLQAGFDHLGYLGRFDGSASFLFEEETPEKGIVLAPGVTS